MPIRWGEITAKECSGTSRKYSAICWDAGAPDGRVPSPGNWEQNCAQLSATYSEKPAPAGLQRPPDESGWIGSNIWGTWFVPEASCGASLNTGTANGTAAGAPSNGGGGGTGSQTSGGNGSAAAQKTCFASLQGEFGEYQPMVQSPLKVNTAFTLRAVNWISGKGQQYATFLRADGGSLRTDDSVQLTDANALPSNFQFAFRRVGRCGGAPGFTLLYGDRVQLYSNGSAQYARCAAGTCSLVPTPNDCGADKWETFTITSPSGKTGEICFGDEVRISQTVGDNADITAAGGGNVWATKHNTNENSVLRILPPNGSMYANVAAGEASAQERDYCEDLCSRDPLNPICTSGACAGRKNKKTDAETPQWLMYVGIGVAAIVVLAIVALVVAQFAKRRQQNQQMPVSAMQPAFFPAAGFGGGMGFQSMSAAPSGYY